ncbi:MAG: alpha/beta hydrolase [Sarcina sp.]
MKEKMKFIPYSNGFYKIKHNKNIKPSSVIKKIIIFVAIILTIGFVYQTISDKVQSKALEPKNKYVRIDNKKYFFKSLGEDKPTVIFESDIGMGIDQWGKVQNLVSDKYKIRTFSYDRAGYGFSEYGKDRNPEDQARLLRMILKKVGLSGPYILVGEGYGSILISNFAKLYPDLVNGVILINPINTNELINSDYSNQFKSKKLLSKIQKYGSYIGLNDLLNKFGLLNTPSAINKYFTEEQLNNYKVFRLNKEFNAAYYNELSNITNLTDNIQKNNLLNKWPLKIIITNNTNNYKYQEELKSLGNSDLTEIINVDNQYEFVSLEKPEIIVEAIKSMVDTLKEQQ